MEKTTMNWMKMYLLAEKWLGDGFNFLFSPQTLGKWSNLTTVICVRWVGNKPPTRFWKPTEWIVTRSPISNMVIFHEDLCQFFHGVLCQVGVVWETLEKARRFSRAPAALNWSLRTFGEGANRGNFDGGGRAKRDNAVGRRNFLEDHPRTWILG